jgi:hypothetical protein
MVHGEGTLNELFVLMQNQEISNKYTVIFLSISTHTTYGITLFTHYLLLLISLQSKKSQILGRKKSVPVYQPRQYCTSRGNGMAARAGLIEVSILTLQGPGTFFYEK